MSYGLKNCRAQEEIITFYNLVIILAARITHTRPAPRKQQQGGASGVCVRQAGFCCCFWRGSRAARVCECVSSSLMLSISLQLGSLLYFQWFPQHSQPKCDVRRAEESRRVRVRECDRLRPCSFSFISQQPALLSERHELRLISTKSYSRAPLSSGHPFIGHTARELMHSIYT